MRAERPLAGPQCGPGWGPGVREAHNARVAAVLYVWVKIDLRLAIAHNVLFWAFGKAGWSWESGRSAVVDNGG